jgi:hypothetical protein
MQTVRVTHGQLAAFLLKFYKAMKNSLYYAALVAASFVLVQTVSAQVLPAASKADMEQIYTTAIGNRTDDILKLLNLTDAAKSNEVHDIIIAQYRVLRARDEAIDAKLKADGKEINYTNRADLLLAQSKPLHEQFFAKLTAILTPEQIEIVKNKMTYNKVAVTYDAYCAIIPGLTDADKAKIMELLKQAREEAVDGGNAPEKSAVFQKYKDQINSYLDAHGYDTAKAFKEWEAKNSAAGNSTAK